MKPQSFPTVHTGHPLRHLQRVHDIGKNAATNRWHKGHQHSRSEYDYEEYNQHSKANPFPIPKWVGHIICWVGRKFAHAMIPIQ
jgi:hypothetical protein